MSEFFLTYVYQEPNLDFWVSQLGLRVKVNYMYFRCFRRIVRTICKNQSGKERERGRWKLLLEFSYLQISYMKFNTYS